ncbi:MAG: UTP--glucose-1-phosphate uridylyltransferase, partial [Planctomycetia bacterium]
MTQPQAAADRRSRLVALGQEHLLRFADELPTEGRAALEAQIDAIDFPLLARLMEESKQATADVDAAAVAPPESVPLPQTDADRTRDREAEAVGLEALSAGRVAVVLVAGGQGSRLGFEHPKGMFPVGPVRGTSLFQIFADQLRYWEGRTGKTIPWYVMTSPENRAETVAYFRDQGFFGLAAGKVRFFVQGTMPAVDRKTGKVLLAEKGQVFTSPNGHGGSLKALRDEGMLDDMAAEGCDLVYYFQVDNVFAKILDPVFLGHHLRSKADLSVKVIRKRHAAEKLGLVVNYHGKASIIEYSDLPKSLGEQTDSDGRLKYW